MSTSYPDAPRLDRRDLIRGAIGFAAVTAVGAAAGAPEDRPAASTKPDRDREQRRSVAILVFEGVELLDFSGPAEVFIAADRGRAFRVVLVAPSHAPIRTIGGLTVTPDHPYDDAPQPDIVVVPGGETQNVGKQGIEWLRRTADKAEIVLSVCWGAFLLAEAGLLDGIRATTHRLAMAGLEKAAPRSTIVRDTRYVESGRIVTAAGVTAGIDGALHVVRRLLGEEAARWTAEVYLEYGCFGVLPNAAATVPPSLLVPPSAAGRP